MVVIDSSEATKLQFAEFADFKVSKVEIQLNAKGFLRFERDNRGYLHISYRIVGWKSAVALEGEVLVEGEFSNEKCREFSDLLSL